MKTIYKTSVDKKGEGKKKDQYKEKTKRLYMFLFYFSI